MNDRTRKARRARAAVAFDTLDLLQKFVWFVAFSVRRAKRVLPHREPEKDALRTSHRDCCKRSIHRHLAFSKKLYLWKKSFSSAG